MSDKVRVLRVLEYVGDREWVDEQIAKRGVKVSFVMRNGRGMIREAIIGDVVELLDDNESDAYNKKFAESLEKGDPI